MPKTYFNERVALSRAAGSNLGISFGSQADCHNTVKLSKNMLDFVFSKEIDDRTETVFQTNAFPPISPYFNGGNGTGNIRTGSVSDDSAMFSGTGESDEEPVYKDENENEMLEFLSNEECHFESLPRETHVRNLSKYKVGDCRCAATIANEDLVCGWESRQQLHKYYRSPKGTKTRKSNTPHVYQRLYQEKENFFVFKHCDNSSDFIQQYRSNHTSVGSTKFPNNSRLPVAEPDPYGAKIKSNVFAIVEQIDLTKSSSQQTPKPDICTNKRDTEKTSTNGTSHPVRSYASAEDRILLEEGEDDDEIRHLSVKDRGKSINLAPVRKQNCVPRTKICKSSIRLPKRPSLVQNQYLNLVVPKTTLQRREIQLDVDESKENYLARFDSSRHTVMPTKHGPNVKRRPDSAESTRRVQASPDSMRKVFNSQGNRASELRMARANTFQQNTAHISMSSQCSNISLDPGTILPSHRSTPSSAKNNLPPRAPSKKKCCERIHAILYGTFPNDDMRVVANKDNELLVVPRPQKVWEGGDRINDQLRNDKVVPIPISQGNYGGRAKSGGYLDDRDVTQYRLKKNGKPTSSKRVGVTAVT